jgi:hypothetical protein
MKFPRFALFSVIAVSALSVTSCNIFSPLSSPSGDAQLLSEARACFDQGNYTCANNDYEKLSSSDADIATSEEAYVTLAQEGASMANLMLFVGDITNVGVGQGLTNFAQRLSSGAGEAKRVAIWNAFHSYNNVQSTNLAQFVRFVGALSLVGEILAEAQGTDTLLHQTDLVQTPATCLSTGSAACLGSNITACENGSGPLQSTAETAPIDGSGAAAPTETYPIADHLNDSLDSVIESLTALGAEGKFGSTLSTFTQIFKTVKPSSAPPATYECFMYSLINVGIGY